MKKLYFLFFALICFLRLSPVQADHLSQNLLFMAKLDGSQETPPVATTAAGAASFMLNGTRDTLFVNAAVTGLSGAITGAHVHEGAIGVAGPIVTHLTPMVSGNMLRGFITGADLTAAHLSKYLQGLYYLNIHTAANPNGEIRGQILLATDVGFTAKLSGAQETPPVTTTATGVGFFNLSQDLTSIKIHAIFEGLSGPVTGAHLHTGAMGVAGPVVLDLGPMLTGNRISGTANPATYLIPLLSGNVYINIHTAANPGGEIRGQLVMDKGISMDANLDGAQEVPAVTTNARGVSSIRLNPTLDSIEVNAMVTGLSGAITGAHIHSGAVGVAGPIVIDLASMINGNKIAGKRSLALLPANTINMLLTGNMYLNVHTAANPAGEIRGQVYRLAREGYTILMEGMQEVPAVTTSGGGAGFVSIDRDQTNATYHLVWSGLSGPATAGHFHLGKRGIAGPVLFDLAPSFNIPANPTAASGAWSGSSTPAFATRNSVQFRSDSIYVNIHTAANPGGEIRGQVIRGAKDLSRVLKAGSPLANGAVLTVFPNPFSQQFTMRVSLAGPEDFAITLTDALGRKVLQQSILLNAGTHEIPLKIPVISKGIYLLEVTSDKSRSAIKVVKD